MKLSDINHSAIGSEVHSTFKRKSLLYYTAGKCKCDKT